LLKTTKQFQLLRIQVAALFPPAILQDYDEYFLEFSQVFSSQQV
jgi:hypothetical protein